MDLRLRRLRPLLPLALAAAGGLASAAPVDGAGAAADPYELALRWTLASLSPQVPDLPPPAAAPALPPRVGMLPPVAAEAGVPEPGAYALMGLALLGAGVAGRRLVAGQRGLSKKT